MGGNSGQKELFFKIWEERPHVCDLCEKHLGSQPMAFHFSHILGKGSYPRIKLLPDNIMLNCFECHREWDQGVSPQSLKNYQKFSEKRDELKIKYNTNKI